VGEGEKKISLRKKEKTERKRKESWTGESQERDSSRGGVK
jgi:hypothetical protein